MRRILRRKWVLAAALASVAVVVLAWMPLWLVDGAAAALPGVVWKAETSRPQAALTFDDGPHPRFTPQVLDILARHNARATFFLIGAHARAHPEIVERIRAAGHEIGNHTDSRRTTLWMSTESFMESLEAAEAAQGIGAPAPPDPAADAGGTAQQDGDAIDAAAPRRKLLRPAGGWIRRGQLAAARQRGYTVVLGSAYAWDGRWPPPAGYIRWVITKNLRPGAIVVLHDAGGDASNSIAALEGILTAGAQRGLAWVTLSALLEDTQAPAAGR